MLRLTVLAIVLFRALPIAAQTQPTAYYSFENDMDGDAGDGRIVSTVVGKPEFVPGKLGSMSLA